MAEKAKRDDKSKSITEKNLDPEYQVDLSEGTSKPYLDEEGGYTEVNRAGPDEPRMDNVKAHGDAGKADSAPGITDRDAILKAFNEGKDPKDVADNVKKAELYLSAELEKQRAPRGFGGENITVCPNCGARLYVADGSATHV